VITIGGTIGITRGDENARSRTAPLADERRLGFVRQAAPGQSPDRSASRGALLAFQDLKIRRPVVETEPSISIGHTCQLY
jgi:hypothetical protein